MKQRHLWWIIGAILVFLLIRTIIRKVAEKNAIKKAQETRQPTGGGTIQTSFVCDLGKVDRKKSIFQGLKNSAEVCYLQTWLNQYYNAGLNVDGDFGAKTRKSLESAKPGAPITFSLDSIGI